jgi:endonuclease-3
MRTSRIAKETSNLINATAGPPQIRRSTRSSIARFSHNAAAGEDDTQDVDPEAVDIEDVIPSRKRKREVTRTPAKRSPGKSTTIKMETEESVIFSPSKPRKVRKPAHKVKNVDGEVEIHPPNDWEAVYAAMKEMRLSGVAQNAAVDTMGCERLGQDDVSPKVKRYHTLTALMLSSQTKDTTNAMAMRRLQTELPAYKEGEPVGLNLENILKVDPVLLNELIWVVGFHNNKTKYIKATAEILRDKFDGDIPDTIEDMMSLPGML